MPSRVGVRWVDCALNSDCDGHISAWLDTVDVEDGKSKFIFHCLKRLYPVERLPYGIPVEPALQFVCPVPYIVVHNPRFPSRKYPSQRKVKDKGKKKKRRKKKKKKRCRKYNVSEVSVGITASVEDSGATLALTRLVEAIPQALIVAGIVLIIVAAAGAPVARWLTAALALRDLHALDGAAELGIDVGLGITDHGWLLAGVLEDALLDGGLAEMHGIPSCDASVLCGDAGLYLVLPPQLLADGAHGRPLRVVVMLAPR
jgi:hypothetical protein